MTRLVTNNFSTTLDGAITNVATSMTLTSVTDFPAVGSGDTCQVTISDGTNTEIVTATAIAGSVITITRGQEGTSGTAFADDDTVEIRMTVLSLTDVLGADASPTLIAPLDMSDSAAYLSFGGSSSTTAYNLVNVGGVPALKGAANYWYTFTNDSLVMQAGTSWHSMILKNDSTRLTIKTNNSERMNINDSGVLFGGSGARVTTVLDEDTMVSDSATALASQQSIKAYIDGAGGGISNVVEDLTPQLGGDLDLNGKNIDFPTTANISDCLDEDDMSSDSATVLATQQSIKAYTDSILVSEQIITTAVTSLTFSSLDSDTDGYYFLELSKDNSISCDWNLHVNGDTTVTNYYSQSLYITGTSVSGVRSNNSNVIFSGTSQTGSYSTVFCNILDNARFVYTSYHGRNLGSTVPSLQNYSGNNTTAITNITSLTLTATSSNGIGIGSVIRLYKGKR